MPEAFDWGERLPVLASPRLELRPIAMDDAPELFAIFSDPETMRYWSSTPITDLAAAQALAARIEEGFQKRTHFQWGVTFPGEDRVIGTCTLFRHEPQHRRAEVGYALLRSHWGKGLASEAVGTVIRFAFEMLDLHRLEADVDPRNHRSLRLLEHQGFRREGYLRERYRVGGEIQDTVLLGMLRREWVAGAAPAAPPVGGAAA